MVFFNQNRADATVSMEEKVNANKKVGDEIAFLDGGKSLLHLLSYLFIFFLQLSSRRLSLHGTLPPAGGRVPLPLYKRAVQYLQIYVRAEDIKQLPASVHTCLLFIFSRFHLFRTFCFHRTYCGSELLPAEFQEATNLLQIIWNIRYDKLRSYTADVTKFEN